MGIRPSALGLGKLESVFDPKTKGRIKMFFLSSFYHQIVKIRADTTLLGQQYMRVRGVSTPT
jgi:hypothetical protein